MHIADDSDLYLSKFSANDYFKYLKTAKIQSPMIYLQSHTGLCNFKTDVSKTHNFFVSHPNEINKLIDLCHKEGMKVVGYYSLIFNNQAIKDHPDWEMVNADGSTWRDHGQRYGLCCPNNKDYKEFLKVQIKELYEAYPNVDALFFDMPYWEVTCHCPSCQEKWAKISNKPMPSKEDWNDFEWKKYVRARQIWMSEFAKFVKEETLKVFKNITVEFNFAAVIGCNWLAGSTEGINESCEFTGGDLYGDLYNHSFTAKYYYGITKHQPFEYMTCRCNKLLREHTISKNELSLESEIMLSSMHHGASLIIDAINPDGTLDNRVAEHIGNVFDKQLPYEKYMNKGVLHGDVGVYFDSRTQYSRNGLASNKEVAIRSTRTLIENHIPVSVIANGNLNNLNQYQMIIAPSLDDFDGTTDVTPFIDYVRNGGTLYLSGASNSKLLKEFFDGKIVGGTNYDSPFKHVYKGFDEVQCYVYPTDKEYEKMFGEFNEKYPLPISYKLPIIDFKKGIVKACINMPFTDPDDNSVFASIHSNPPGICTKIPAIVENNYGKGKVIYSSALLENDDRYNFKSIFMNLVNKYVKPILKVEASKYVESIIFDDNASLIVNLFDLNFANDIVERKFKINTNGFKVYKLPENKEIKVQNNLMTGTFEKYISFYFKKEE